jgi:hypothetical protein
MTPATQMVSFLLTQSAYEVYKMRQMQTIIIISVIASCLTAREVVASDPGKSCANSVAGAGRDKLGSTSKGSSTVGQQTAAASSGSRTAMSQGCKDSMVQTAATCGVGISAAALKCYASKSPGVCVKEVGTAAALCAASVGATVRECRGSSGGTSSGRTGSGTVGRR